MKEQEKLKATVLKLYSAGTKVADIVTQTGVPRSTVYYWIKNEIPKETSPLNLRDYHFLKQKCERQEKIIAILKSAPCAATAPFPFATRGRYPNRTNKPFSLGGGEGDVT